MSCGEVEVWLWCGCSVVEVYYGEDLEITNYL